MRNGWQEEYDTYLWSFYREQAGGDGYIVQELSTLDMITDYTFWMQQSMTIIARPDGYNFIFSLLLFLFIYCITTEWIVYGIPHQVAMFSRTVLMPFLMVLLT